MAHWLREDYGFRKEDWYNPYEMLNDMPLPPNPAILKQIQIDAIKMNNSKLQVEINHLNNFLQEFQKFAKQELAMNSEADFFVAFNKKLNQGYGFFDMSDMSQIKPKDTSWLQKYVSDIQNFTEIIAKYSKKEIPANIIEHISRIAHHIEKGNFYGFQNRKAQLWEDLSEWILTMAGFGAIGTGQIIDAAGKQMIQDTIGFLPTQVKNKTAPSKGGLKMSMRITGTSSKKANKELLDIVNKKMGKQINGTAKLGPKGYVEFSAKGEIAGFSNLVSQAKHSVKKKVTIKINDDTKDYLSQFLSVQAKSGSNQALLNNQKRDRIDIHTLADWDQYLNTLNRFYMNFSQEPSVDEGKSEKLAAYTNWVFSKNIAKTTLGKNTFFLSHYGFATLDQMMASNNFYFKLAPNPHSLKLLNSTSFSIEEQNG